MIHFQPIEFLTSRSLVSENELILPSHHTWQAYFFIFIYSNDLVSHIIFLKELLNPNVDFIDGWDSKKLGDLMLFFTKPMANHCLE